MLSSWSHGMATAFEKFDMTPENSEKELQKVKMIMPLDQELETYRKNLPSLVADEGKYVLISDSEVIGVFSAYDDALTAGYEKFGVKPFLVKKIMALEQVQNFTRDLAPCHS